MRRDNCRSCGHKGLEKIISLGDLYLSKFSGKMPPKYPLNLVRCDNCSLVQLRDTTPPDELYTDDYGYYSGINQTMKDHLAEIAHTAERLVSLNYGDTVIDIGCNDGTLLNAYQTEGIYKVGFDPVSKFGENVDSYAFVNSYFHHVRDIPKAKIITAISMFYDLDDPNKFLDDIIKSLHPEGIFVIQQNYLKSMLEQLAFDNIVHEHLEYYTIFSLQGLLRKYSLEIFNVELNNLNGGSFRTYIKFTTNHSFHVSTLTEKMLNDEIQFFVKNPGIYENFAQNVKDDCQKIHDFISEVTSNGKTVYAYGASTRGNTLLQACNLNNRLIAAAVERNSDKYGGWIMSLGIPIISEEQARIDKPDYMLVLPWFFRTEFLKREKDYLKKGGAFIFPLPEFDIVR